MRPQGIHCIDTKVFGYLENLEACCHAHTAGFSPANLHLQTGSHISVWGTGGGARVRRLFLYRLHTQSFVTFSINKPVGRHPDRLSRFYLTWTCFFFSRLDYFHSGGTRWCTWQFTNSHWTNVFLFLFFLYELPIFAIQNFVNMQISFISLLQVFKDCLGGIILLLKITMNTLKVRICG